MDLVAEIDAMFVEFVEDGHPAGGELFETRFDQTRGTLRPGVHGGPEERAAEGRMSIEAEVLGGFRGIFQLLYGPFLPGFGVIVHGGRGEAIEEGVVGWMHGNQLALEMGGQFGDLQACVLYDALDLVGIGLAFGGFLQIDDAAIPGR